MFEGAEHHAGNLVSGMRPDVDDLVVTLAIGDDALAILLLNLPDLLVSIFELRLFLFRNDHVRNSNRDSGLGRLGKTKLFQFVQRRDRLGWSRDLVTAPNDVAQLFLARSLVEESKLLRPNFIEDDTARRGLDNFGLSISVDRLPARIRVLNPDTVVRMDTSFCHGKFHFGRIGK
jgi:hypothetical protein